MNDTLKKKVPCTFIMGKKVSQADETLYLAVDEVLHYIWDPIGVSHAPQARKAKKVPCTS